MVGGVLQIKPRALLVVDKKSSTLDYVPQNHVGPLPIQVSNYNDTDSK